MSTGEWFSSTFSCCNPVDLCCKTCLCSCFVAGSIASRLGQNYTLCCCGMLFCPSCVVAVLRGDVRRHEDIPGGCIEDVLCSLFCPLCTLVQLEKQMAKSNKMKTNQPPQQHQMGPPAYQQPPAQPQQQPQQQGGVVINISSR